MFVRRDRRGFHRVTWWRLGLLFLAAGTWLAGVTADRPVVTAVAIGLMLMTLLLGLVGRGDDAPPGPPDDD